MKARALFKNGREIGFLTTERPDTDGAFAQHARRILRADALQVREAKNPTDGFNFVVFAGEPDLEFED